MNCTVCLSKILPAYLFDQCVLSQAICHKKCTDLLLHNENLWLCHDCIMINMPFSVTDDSKDSLAQRNVVSEKLMNV